MTIALRIEELRGNHRKVYRLMKKLGSCWVYEAVTPDEETAWTMHVSSRSSLLSNRENLFTASSQPSGGRAASDESPYLEVHHMVPLASGGEDTVENAVAICPNCHREAHLGVPTKVVLAALIVYQGKILIARRGPGRSQEGMWAFSRGKLEFGETFEQGLEREILEELGIGIKAIQHFGDSLSPYSEGSIRLKAYWSKWIEGDIQLHEYSEVKWVAF